VHLRQLELCFSADSGREGCVADDESESLSIGVRISACFSFVYVFVFQFVVVVVVKRVFAYRSVSLASKTLRFVWSRRVRTLTKQPRSSFLARNIDMMGGFGGDCR
jgi:hypothetical protein